MQRTIIERWKVGKNMALNTKHVETRRAQKITPKTIITRYRTKLPPQTNGTDLVYSKSWKRDSIEI